MPIMVILEGRAKPEAVDRLKAALPGVFPDTRAYDGCRGITAYINADDGRTIVFVEYWETKAHHERYLAWRTETGVIARLVSMLQEPPSIRYFDQIDA
jgi:quinol monooxygenase YgiN